MRHHPVPLIWFVAVISVLYLIGATVFMLASRPVPLSIPLSCVAASIIAGYAAGRMLVENRRH